MESIGTYVIYVIMVCAVLGAVASIYNPEGELGQEFIAGLHSIGPIFIPVAGIMAAIPYISAGISHVIAPLFQPSGPILHCRSHLHRLGHGRLPVSQSAGAKPGRLDPRPDHRLSVRRHHHLRHSGRVGHAAQGRPQVHGTGIMAGLLTIPLSIMIIAMTMQALGLSVRPDIATTGAATQALHFTWAMLLRNLMPLILFCIALAAALRYFPTLMVYLFLKLGQFMYIAVVLVLVASIVQYFTGLFSHLFGSWGFAPIIADADDQFRALEIAGYIGLMLCGAFPMVHLLKRFLARPIERVASRFGMSGVGAAGVLAASANILAMFRLVSEMPPKDKVLVIAFSVCAAFTFGDHMAFSANFQPSLILPLMIGKLSGGLIAMLLASWLAVPKAQELGRQDAAAGVCKGVAEPS